MTPPSKPPISAQESDALASRLGAHPLLDGTGTRFRLWSTRAREAAVRVNGTLHPMQAQGGGVFEVILPVGPGTRYMFVLDGVDRPDPYARFLPDGVHGEAEVMDLNAFAWQHTGWRGVPLEDCVFYELHVGTFTPGGTYRTAVERLPELAQLGVTAIQLMPLAAFAGRHGWGYDGVALYAPHAPYGRPEDLMAFIDAAHGLGLGVFVDVVYNHFGPDGNYLAAYSPSYFTDRFHSAWGEGLDYAEPHMRRYVTGNARMWLRDYHVDGLRLDATQAMTDDSPVHILTELADEVHKLRGTRGTHLLLAEDYRNLPELVTEHELDGIWVDDFHHEVRVTLTGDRDGYYAPYQGGAAALAHVINRGWVFEGQTWPLEDRPRGRPADVLDAVSLVYYVQNHDQVGNRPVGDRMHHLERVSAAHFRGASLLLLSLPMTPLLFMGQEWASSSPFPFFSDHHAELGRLVTEGRRKEFGHFTGFDSSDVLDPQDEVTFQRAKLNWAEREEGEHGRTLALYQSTLKLRRNDLVLRHRDRADLSAGQAGDVLWVRRQAPAGERVLLWNTGTTSVRLDGLTLPFPLPGRVMLHSERPNDADGGPVVVLAAGEAVLFGSGA